MTKPTIIILVGGQNSGKSTWAETHPAVKKIVSRDRIRESYAHERHLAYQDTFSPAHNTRVNSLFLDVLKLALADRIDPIIIDNTNMRVKDRKTIIDTVNEYGFDYQRTAVVFPLPVKEALRRNVARDVQWHAAGKSERSIPEAVIRTTYAGYEPPQQSEGFDTICGYMQPGILNTPALQNRKISKHESMFTANGLLNPDMAAQEMRLHMGEMTAQEMRTSRAAIRWANSYRRETERPVVSGQQAITSRDMVNLAKEAGAAIMAQLKEGIAVDSKDENSPFTAADVAADALIKAGLRRLTPDIPIISEENTLEDREPIKDGALRWIIDPLDGTRTAIDYANGRRDHNQFGVHIGLVMGNKPIAGVACFPAMADGKGVTYFTGDDGHAYKQAGDAAPKRIQVAKPPFKNDGLRAAVHFHEDRRPDMIVGRPYQAVPGVGGQRLCLVAEGAADVADMNDIPEIHRGEYAYKQWDVSAAHAILRAAGGELVATHDQQPVTYDHPEQKIVGGIAGGIHTLKLLGIADLPLTPARLKR